MQRCYKQLEIKPTMVDKHAFEPCNHPVIMSWASYLLATVCLIYNCDAVMLQKLLHAQKKKKKMKRDNYENIIIGLIQFSESWIFLKSKSKYSDAYLYEIKAYETKRGEKEREGEVGYFSFFRRARSCTSAARFAAGHLYNFPRRDNEDYAVVIIIVGGNQAVDRVRHGEKVVAAVYCQASGLLERPELLDNRPRPTVVCRCGCVTSLLCEW